MSDNINNQLSSTSLLICLSCGLPRQSRQAKDESREVEQAKRAARGTFKGSKWYFQQTQQQTNARGTVTDIIIDALAHLKSYHNAWGTAYEELAPVVWLGKLRLLPAVRHRRAVEIRAHYEEGYQAVKDEFREVYGDWHVTAPQRMGMLHSEADFPSLEECMSRIHADTIITPLADSDAWQRIALINPQHVAQETERTRAAEERARREAQTEIGSRLIDHFRRMNEVLDSNKVRIHETLISGLTGILDDIEVYGPLFQDQTLLQCAAEARATFGTITPDMLREDPALQQQVNANARGMVERFGQLGARRMA